MQKLKRTVEEPGRDCGENYSRLKEKSRGRMWREPDLQKVQRNNGRRLRKPKP